MYLKVDIFDCDPNGALSLSDDAMSRCQNIVWGDESSTTEQSSRLMKDANLYSMVSFKNILQAAL